MGLWGERDAGRHDHRRSTADARADRAAIGREREDVAAGDLGVLQFGVINVFCDRALPVAGGVAGQGVVGNLGHAGGRMVVVGVDVLAGGGFGHGVGLTVHDDLDGEAAGHERVDVRRETRGERVELRGIFRQCVGGEIGERRGGTADEEQQAGDGGGAKDSARVREAGVLHGGVGYKIRRHCNRNPAAWQWAK